MDTKPNTKYPIFPNSDLVLCDGQLVAGARLPLLSLRARAAPELGVPECRVVSITTPPLLPACRLPCLTEEAVLFRTCQGF